jgi:hypothetical protein
MAKAGLVLWLGMAAGCDPGLVARSVGGVISAAGSVPEGSTGAGRPEGGSLEVGADGSGLAADGGSEAQLQPDASIPTDCSDLVFDAPLAPVRFNSGERPPDEFGEGGTIVDGVYDLAGTDVYRSTNAEPTTSRIVIRISGRGTNLEWVTEGVAFVRTLSTRGAEIEQVETCRSSASLQPPVREGYTATPMTLTLSNPLAVQRFARRDP